MVAQIDPTYRQAGLGPSAVRLLSWAFFEGRPLTTRGRWINPLVLGLLRLHCHLPRLKRVEAPIYIIGMGRSGTTLLGKILSLHPEVGFLNEPKALWHVAVGDEDVVGSYERGPARYQLDSTDAGARERRRLERLYAAYLRWTCRRRLVDKNPEVVYRIDFVRRIFPDARFLYLVRDGWSVCRSVAAWTERHRTQVGDEVQDWWGAERRKWHLLVDQLATPESDLAPVVSELSELDDQRQMAALEWLLAGRHADRAARAHDDVHVVRYEDVASEPSEAIASVLEFCGLRPDDRVIAYCRRAVHDASPASRFELHPALEQPFLAALNRWGYGG